MALPTAVGRVPAAGWGVAVRLCGYCRVSACIAGALYLSTGTSEQTSRCLEGTSPVSASIGKVSSMYDFQGATEGTLCRIN